MTRFMLIAIAMLMSSFSAVSAGEVRVGVIAPRGAVQVMKRWQEFGNHLSQEMNQKVKIVPMEPRFVFKMMKNKEVDFMLNNPVFTVFAEKQFDGKPLLSLDKGNGSQFGGLIVVRKDSGLKTAKDLKGKKVLGMVKKGAGGYLFQAHYLKNQGLNVDKDFNYRITKSQADILVAVKKGLVDAGFVRTGMVKRIIKKGLLADGELAIIDEKKSGSFPLSHTTQLYPEWFLTALTGDHAMKDKVVAAAKALKADSEAAKKAGIKGFIDPRPREQTAKMMSEMGVLK